MDTNSNQIIEGDSLEKLKDIEDDSIDLIVTDPPYFLISDSGKGFMGKDWDSININTGYPILCKSKEFANFVINCLRLLKIESNTIGAYSVQENVNTNISVNQDSKNLQSNVHYVEKNSNEVNPKSKVNINSVQTVALTKVEVLDLLNELSVNPTTLKEFQNLPENVLFVIPYSYLVKRFKGVVPEIVLKLPTEQTCEAKEIQVSLMDEVRIKSVIEAMIGNVSELKSTNEIITAAEYVENIANGKKSKHIILQNIEKQKITRWIIWLLYAINVTQRRNTIPNSMTICYDLIYQFHKAWASESLRVLKSGAFAFVMSAPRSDVLDVMIQALKDSGFVTSFSPIFWTFASGFPKAANTTKLLKKRGIDKPELDGSYLGCQLKPAVEVVLTVMKPLSEKTFVDQALSNGKGITWLDDCRIPFQNEKEINKMKHTVSENTHYHSRGTGWDRPWRYNEEAIQRCKERKQEVVDKAIEKGRFPANLLVSDDALNDGKITNSPKSYIRNNEIINKIYGKGKGSYPIGEYSKNYGDSGSYSRYFDLDSWYDNRAQFIITPKTSASERNKGLENCEKKEKYSDFGLQNRIENGQITNSRTNEQAKLSANNHPTVKPLKLMSYLITMGSMENDIVLDPFCGSGTTLIAAHLLNRRWIGIELNAEYAEIARKRIEPYLLQTKFYI